MIVLVAILFLATCMDLKSFRISNRLILAGYLMGLIYHLTEGPFQSMFHFSLSAIVIWFLTVPLFFFHVIGGGDCKLLTVCALFTGFTRTISIGIYAFLLAGMVCIVLLAVRRLFPNKIRKINKIHFSVYLLLGTLLEYGIGGAVWGIESFCLM